MTVVVVVVVVTVVGMVVLFDDPYLDTAKGASCDEVGAVTIDTAAVHNSQGVT